MLRIDLIRYLTGLCAVFAGAWLLEVTGSLIPLALGGSVALMATAGLVRRLSSTRRRRRSG